MVLSGMEFGTGGGGCGICPKQKRSFPWGQTDRVRGFEKFRLSPVEVGAVWVAASSRAVFIVNVSPSLNP